MEREGRERGGGVRARGKGKGEQRERERGREMDCVNEGERGEQSKGGRWSKRERD